MDHLSENTLFLFVCMLFSVFGPERNRNVWSVLTFACFLNIILGAAVFDKMDSAWLPMWYGALECLTIGMLYRFAWNALGKMQALILGEVWITHLCLYLDVGLGSNIVYGQYEHLILAAMILQLLLGTNGLFEMAREYRFRAASFLALYRASNPSIQMGLVRNPIKTQEAQGIRRL